MKRPGNLFGITTLRPKATRNLGIVEPIFDPRRNVGPVNPRGIVEPIFNPQGIVEPIFQSNPQWQQAMPSPNRPRRRA